MRLLQELEASYVTAVNEAVAEDPDAAARVLAGSA